MNIQLNTSSPKSFTQHLLSVLNISSSANWCLFCWGCRLSCYIICLARPCYIAGLLSVSVYLRGPTHINSTVSGSASVPNYEKWLEIPLWLKCRPSQLWDLGVEISTSQIISPRSVLSADIIWNIRRREVSVFVAWIHTERSTGANYANPHCARSHHACGHIAWCLMVTL